jgi:hypothetical protein
MTHQSPLRFARTPVDAGRQVAQLRHVLTLVEQMADRAPQGSGQDSALDESARIGASYGDAPPIVQRRFDTLASETAAWSAAGVEALLAASGTSRPAAAARRLADELRAALERLTRILAL